MFCSEPWLTGLARFNAAKALGQVLNTKSKEENSSTDGDGSASDKEDHISGISLIQNMFLNSLT